MAIQRVAALVLVAAVLAGLGAWPAMAEQPYPIAWSQQFGLSTWDVATSVAASSSGTVCVTGFTNGNLGGTSAGDFDAFVAKYSSRGVLLWKRQLGTAACDDGYGVAIDASDNVYIAGAAQTDPESPNFFGRYNGGGDAYVAKYNANGTFQWKQTLGTPQRDYANGVAADSTGNAFVAGYTEGALDGANRGNGDAFLAKLDALGHTLWTRQIGTPGTDWAWATSADRSGNAFVAGYTYGTLAGGSTISPISDGFLAKYGANGNNLWTRQLSLGGATEVRGMAVDASGNSFVTGFTSGSAGSTNHGGRDIFLTKCDPDGNVLWTQLLGSGADDFGWGVSLDSLGCILVTGETYGSLGGTNHGIDDALLAKFDSSGHLLWVTQMGTSGMEAGFGVAVGPGDVVDIAGLTNGSLFGTNQGSYDPFLVQFTPEPATLTLLALGGLFLLRRRKRNAWKAVGNDGL